MGTYILDKKQAVAFSPDPSQYNVMIRITDPTSEFSELEHSSSFSEILSLKFYDIEDENSVLYLFNETHLTKIMEFFIRHKNCNNMVIHCDEGRSRSAGVAAGWFLYNDVKSSIYKLYHDRFHYPNKRIVLFFFRQFGEDIRRIDKWEKELFGKP
jgi:predicted protein tyrosine phosphatase